MTRSEKIKKATAIAVAYYLEQEKAQILKDQNSGNISWGRSGVEMTMTKTKIVQKRGKSLRSA